MSISAEMAKNYEDIRKVKDRISPEFLARPGIKGIGVSFHSRWPDMLAIRFYLDKNSSSVLGPDDLPREIEGVPTDTVSLNLQAYVERRPSSPDRKPCSPEAPEIDKNKYDPLLGGISIGPSRSVRGGDLAGTLGVMVKDAATGDAMMLSNFHVMCGDDGKFAKGDEICQPSRVDSIIEWCSNCAKLERWHAGNHTTNGKDYGMDAAVALQTHRKTDLYAILEIAGISGAAWATSAMLKDKVLKRGRVTELTEGELEDVAADFNEDFGPPFGKVVMKNQLVTKPINFIQTGDSGSVLVRDVDKTIIGLNYATSNDTGWTVSNQIEAVMDKLGFKIAP